MKMKESYYIPGSDDVLVILDQFSKVVPYHTIKTEDFLNVIRQYIQIYLQNNKRIKPEDANDITSAWVDEGVECDLLIPNQNWKKGTLRLALIFEESEPTTEVNLESTSPLDDIRQKINQQNEGEI